MLIEVAFVVGFLFASKSETPDAVAFSVPDSLRVGSVLVSRFLRPGGTRVFSSFFKKYARSKVRTMGEERGEEPEDFIPAALGLLGFDSTNVENFALDGFISLLHLMKEVATKSGRTERNRGTSEEFSPFRFLLRQPRVLQILGRVQDPGLADLLLKESEERLEGRSPEDVDCIRLLMCTIKPFVRGMQRSLDFFLNRENVTQAKGGCRGLDSCPEDASWEKSALEDRMYFFAPSLKEVVQQGDECAERFSNCVY